MLPKCFVVNMESSVERRESIKAQFQHIGLDYEFFAATDGRKLTEEEQAKCKTEDRVELPLRLGRKVIVTNKLVPAEIGCAMSHLRLYQHILDLGLERALILEDDVVLHSEVKVALEALDCITEDWDIVNFSHFMGLHELTLARKYRFGDNQSFYFKRAGMNNVYLDVLCNQRRLLALAFGYVVTRHACEVLLKLGYPVRMPADYLTGLICYNELKVFRAYPLQRFITVEEKASTIGGRPDHMEHV